MKLPIVTLFALLFLVACQNSTDNTSSEAPAQAESTPPPAQEMLPAMPADVKQKLFNECTAVDYIFYDEPFTMSLVEKPAIQYVVSHIGDAPAAINPACKPNGHITYQINGDIFLEADFYYANGCTYFIFTKKQQKVYASNMTQEGLGYINNQIQQAAKMRQQMEGGAK
ncbi:MAG: hypothetical protein Kow0027_04750 [Saprospiraceae bacterium]|nr:MAG: hypothetical protein D6816_02535 [Bacteroidota bacterium]